MRTARFSDSRGICQHTPLQRHPWPQTPPGHRPLLDTDPSWTQTPWKKQETRDRDPRSNMGPDSQTGSDIIQRPPVDRLKVYSLNVPSLQLGASLQISASKDIITDIKFDNRLMKIQSQIEVVIIRGRKYYQIVLCN